MKNNKVFSYWADSFLEAVKNKNMQLALFKIKQLSLRKENPITGEVDDFSDRLTEFKVHYENFSETYKLTPLKSVILQFDPETPGLEALIREIVNNWPEQLEAKGVDELGPLEFSLYIQKLRKEVFDFQVANILINLGAKIPLGIIDYFQQRTLSDVDRMILCDWIRSRKLFGNKINTEDVVTVRTVFNLLNLNDPIITETFLMNYQFDLRTKISSNSVFYRLADSLAGKTLQTIGNLRIIRNSEDKDLMDWNPNEKVDDYPLLHKAIRYLNFNLENRCDTIKGLIACGADVNSRDNLYRTALYNLIELGLFTSHYIKKPEFVQIAIALIKAGTMVVNFDCDIKTCWLTNSVIGRIAKFVSKKEDINPRVAKNLGLILVKLLESVKESLENSKVKIDDLCEKYQLVVEMVEETKNKLFREMIKE